MQQEIKQKAKQVQTTEPVEAQSFHQYASATAERIYKETNGDENKIIQELLKIKDLDYRSEVRHQLHWCASLSKS